MLSTSENGIESLLISITSNHAQVNRRIDAKRRRNGQLAYGLKVVAGAEVLLLKAILSWRGLRDRPGHVGRLGRQPGD